MNKMNRSQDFDSYEIEEPSDEEQAQSSSEDELEILLNGTPQQKKKLIREYLTGESESSSADEFEKEMEAELNSTMRDMEGSWGPGTSAPGQAETSGGGGGGGEAANPQMYDKVYFDSDSEEEDTPSSSTGKRRRQRTVLTNDELLYDPDEDDRDQAWVDNKRRQYQSRRRPPGGARAAVRSQGLCSSDAVLNCPACMTTLCLDCQRHEKYRTQYRAMFVMNCTVKKDEVLRYKTQPDPRKFRNRRKRKAPGTQTGPELNQGQNQGLEQGLNQEQRPDQRPEGLDSEEVYHPVQCSECSTEVAVFDKDEVYHFFNILASHC
ncbi:E2F-associated phosphoprotein [Boleophthalmus pectinirostris]|uniref:E2F-associated phosphoprotein n=1 Tax=Boleophthalmus pectinirostris TaxID=150288 RepID=UPI000A1C20E1|nr:E2F-associated phosphoprotein [Boleophthalmus pectinirostris]